MVGVQGGCVLVVAALLFYYYCLLLHTVIIVVPRRKKKIGKRGRHGKGHSNTNHQPESSIHESDVKHD